MGLRAVHRAPNADSARLGAGDAGPGYCACYANAYARLFRGTPSARVSVRIDSQARVACMNRPAP